MRLLMSSAIFSDDTCWMAILATHMRRSGSLPLVRAVSAERRAMFRANPGDPALSAPEGAPGTPPDTNVEWWPAREGFPAAWDLTTGDGALVGVIDSGVDGAHPELAGKIARADDLDGNPAHGPAT